MTTQNNPSECLFLAAFISCLAAGMIPGLVKLPRKPELPLETEGKIVISTKETYYHSRLKPRFSILIAVIAIFFVGLILSKGDKWLALLTLVTSSFTIALPILEMRIKEVSIVDNGLMVSDFSKSETVPFSNIKEVKAGNARATAAYVFVEFVSKGIFGKKIYFRPVDRLEIKRAFEPHGIKFIDSSW